MSIEAVRAWLEARYDDDERAASRAMRENPLGLVLCLHLPPEVQQHNDRHDPARVLRDVEAKRRRLKRHAPAVFGSGVFCSRCDDGQAFGEGWPCPDIIDDAQAYTDRPGFPDGLRLT